MLQLSGTKMIEKRLATRYDCNIIAKIETKFGCISCKIENISSTGLKASANSVASMVLGQFVKVSQAELGKVQGTVIWTSMGKFGIAFSRPISGAKLSTMLK